MFAFMESKLKEPRIGHQYKCINSIYERAKNRASKGKQLANIIEDVVHAYAKGHQIAYIDKKTLEAHILNTK